MLKQNKTNQNATPIVTFHLQIFKTTNHKNYGELRNTNGKRDKQAGQLCQTGQKYKKQTIDRLCAVR